MHTQSKQKAVAVAVAVSLLPVAQHVESELLNVFAFQHVQNIDARAERQETSELIYAQIRALWAGCDTLLQYLQQVDALFGNGQKGKNHVPGTIKAKLAAEFASDGALRTLLSTTRTVATHVSDTDGAFADTFYGMYREALKAKKPKGDSNVAGPRDDSAKKPGTVEIASAETARRWVESNILDALDVIERALVARKETIDAGGVHAIRERLVERAKKAS